MGWPDSHRAETFAACRMTDPATDTWLDQQQRQHNLNTYRWPAEKRQPRPRYKFEPWHLAAAIRSLEKAETYGNREPQRRNRDFRELR
jgi:hypothetical protein